MARKLGTYPLSSNIEIEAGAPLDARTIVPLKADLTRVGSFSYPYVGMEVFVTEELQKYRLIGTNPELTDNWTKTDKGVVDGYYDAEHGGFYKDQGFTKPITGTSEVLYIDKSTDNVYRWNGSAFSQINPIDSQVPTIDMADERENIAQNDDVATIMGKIAKYFDDLGEVAFSDDYDDLDNAPTKLSEFENDPGYITDEGIVTSVKVGNTSYDPVDGVVSLPQYPDISGKADKATTIAGYGITDAKIANGTITLGANTITPVTDISGKADKATTLAGYGITDAKIASGTITLGSNTITPVTDVSGKADKATTLAGYGITDAKIANGVITLGSNSITPLTQHQDISGKADKATTLAGYGITDAKITSGTITLGSNTITPLTQHQDISGKADKATTLAGYGITDAKIASGTITLGSNTITPLTQHQSVTDNNPTLSWGTKSKVATIGSTAINVTMPSNPNTDTKVTSVGNHYAPAEDSTAQLDADASSSTAATWNSTSLVTGVTVKRDAKGHVTGLAVDSIKMPANPNTNTTYTFADGTNGFTVTPSGGTAQTVKVTPSITNNVTGSGTSGYLAKFNGVNTITSGPQLGSSTTTYLRNDGSWATPPDNNTTYTLSVDGNNIKLTPSSGSANSITVPYATSASSSISATKATQDDNGNVIATTYSTKSETTIFKGNLSSTLGSGTPAAATKTYWENNSNIPINTVNTAYNTSGTEYTLLFSKGGSNSYGSVVKYGYNDRYMYILRRNSGSWQSTDWEKMYAGYADSAGSVAWSNVSSKPTTLAGYGITDAKIANGVITLGSNTITPLTSITSSQVTTALGYTPYNSSNPNGYITSSGSCASATKATQDGSGNVITSTYSTKSETTIYKGNLTSLGSGTPAAATKTYWEDNTNIPVSTVSIAYNTSGAEEYTLILSKGSSNNYGSVVKYGYTDRYLYILRRNGGTWQSTDWEKMYAGYADSAGSVAWANVSGRPTNVSSFTNDSGYITSSGSCASATKATQDGSGNVITSTYMKKDVDYVTAGWKADTVLGSRVTIEGYNNTAAASYAHAEGYTTTANGYASHAEGRNTSVTAYSAHAEGYYSEATGKYSHAEGNTSAASSDNSHAEGEHTIASGIGSHSEGGPYQPFSYLDPTYTTASGKYSHAEGQGTRAISTGSHSEGINTEAYYSAAHAEGEDTHAYAPSAHSEGGSTTASGNQSHAEGYGTEAKGYQSHAEGFYTIAGSDRQHVEGKYNVEDENDLYAHIIGGGTENERKNILTVDWSGQLTSAADLVFSSKPLRAVGSRQASATNPKDLLNELRFSSGCMGSYSQSSSYTKGSTTLPAGWYNYIWIPHRWGGINWTATGDNCNYGTCILCGMTMDAFAVLRLSGGDVGSVHKWY